jgi:hypothetical protein
MCDSKAVFPLAKVSVIMPAIMLATATRTVLALATLGDATQIGSFLFAKVSKQGTITHVILHMILCQISPT